MCENSWLIIRRRLVNVDNAPKAKLKRLLRMLTFVQLMFTLLHMTVLGMTYEKQGLSNVGTNKNAMLVMRNDRNQ